MNDVLGIKFWEGIIVDGVKTSIRYDQKQNAVEAIIRKILLENGIQKGYLESCSISSFCTIMEGMGYLTPDRYFRFPNGKTVQMDDAVMCFVNDPHNDGIFKTGDVMDNRYIDNLPILAELYSCEAFIKPLTGFDQLASHLVIGNGVQVHLKDPKHYISLIAYDRKADEIIFHDPWGTRNIGAPALKNGGKYERMTRADVYNLQDTICIYTKKAA